MLTQLPGHLYALRGYAVLLLKAGHSLSGESAFQQTPADDTELQAARNHMSAVDEACIWFNCQQQPH